MTFGEKVRTARLHAGLTQRELAEMSGLSLRTILNYENQNRIPKKRSTYTQLAEALQLPPESLLDEDAEFILQTTEQYGSSGRRQALELTGQVRGLYAGGELDEEDLEAMMKAIQDAYWIAKARLREKRAKGASS